MSKYLENLTALRSMYPDYISHSTKWLAGKFRSPDKKTHFVNLKDIQVGSFYFMKYDSRSVNKSSKMEQTVPMLVVDYKDKIDKRVLWILNMNFMPINIKVAFMSSFMEKFPNAEKFNAEVEDTVSEQPLNSITYDLMWRELIKYGFEYAIREIRVELIEKVLKVSTDNLHYLTTVNTQILTGVDEGKLNEIWITKLKNESIGERAEELLQIKNNYYAILEELADKFKFLDRRLKGL